MKEHILEDVRDGPDPELAEELVEGDAVEPLLPKVEEEADRWSVQARILATSLRSFAIIPEMVCCCLLVLVGSTVGCGWGRGGGEGVEGERE